MVPNNSHTLALFFKRIQQNKDEFSDTLLESRGARLITGEEALKLVGVSPTGRKKLSVD
jgi:hypothetical protein